MPFAETILQLKTYRVNFDREGVKPYTEAESEPMKLINPSIYWKYFGGELFLLKQLAQIVFSVLSSSSICETKFRDSSVLNHSTVDVRDFSKRAPDS